VTAPGEALPSWQILCRIAQKLGIPGFDYENAAQIRAESEAMSTSLEPVSVPGVLEHGLDVLQWVRREEHSYMGFPLGTWVAGFRALHPESK
jgi:predicted molibdopterin-dependent oxidoreductase YjgC